MDMSNNSHITTVSTLCENMSNSYMELQKKTTDILKAFLGLSLVESKAL